MFANFTICNFLYYYINSNKIIEESKKEIQNEILDKNQNNLIRNLIYEVKFDNNTQYIISAELVNLSMKMILKL